MWSGGTLTPAGGKGWKRPEGERRERRVPASALSRHVARGRSGWAPAPRGKNLGVGVDRCRRPALGGSFSARGAGAEGWLRAGWHREGVVARGRCSIVPAPPAGSVPHEEGHQTGGQHYGSRIWVGCTEVRGGGAPKILNGAPGPTPLCFPLSSGVRSRDWSPGCE